ncbi:MAG TPA: hypothetical protein PLR88_04070 [Bacteroidales bacterium]|nr:hypothetical protein [Bacteroidales bacterium]
MNDFLCPKCGDHLRVGENIIFKIKNAKKQKALLLLSPQIGNYSSVKHPDFEVKQGELVEFFCPLCDSSLRSDIHQNLNHVIMKDEHGKKFDIYFSRIAGEQSTYETNGESMHVAGKDAGRYTYFKIGEKYKKYF